MNAIADYRTYTLISPLLSVSAAVEHIDVTWGDQRVSRYHNLWLRDNCPCSECVYSVTREQVFQIADVAIDIQTRDVAISASGALRVMWDDGHVSEYDAGWLRAHAYDAQSLAEQAAQKPRAKCWHSDLSLPVFDYQQVQSDDQVLLEWLLAVRETGLSQLQNMPTEPGTLPELIKRIAFIRQTNFGVLFDVRSKANADSNAYTAFNLPLHTDLPTRELQPGLQFLHCLVNDATGGNSTFVDGFAIAEALSTEQPEYYRLLTQTPIEFRNKDRYSDYRCLAPVIALDSEGRVSEVRMANFLRGPFQLPVEVMRSYYLAYRRFIEMTREARFRFTQRLEAGQMWCFDNRRVMHARDAFDPASGNRHFQGCYVDRDELLSRILVLQR